MSQDSEFGCCDDLVTPAKAEDLNNCPSECIHSSYGCCPDGKTASRGPGHAGCVQKIQIVFDKPCIETEFGCCSDGFTAALSPLKENCVSNLSTEISTSSKTIDTTTTIEITTTTATETTTTIEAIAKEKNIELKLSKPYHHHYHNSHHHSGEPCINTPFECCPDGVSVAHVNLYF